MPLKMEPRLKRRGAEDAELRNGWGHFAVFGGMKLRLAAAFPSPHRMGRGIKGEGRAVAWDFQTLLRSNIGAG